MKADYYGVLEIIFSNGRSQYQIPVYQRNYDWKKENCLVLYNDVINSFKEERKHFLGTIVRVKSDEEGGVNKYIIIDGQQRITTIYLLLKALYDSLNEGLTTKEDIHDLLFNNNFGSTELKKEDSLRLKLKPIKSDDIQLNRLMSSHIEEMDPSSNIYINYSYFLALIKASIKDGLNYTNIFTGIKKLHIVLIDLSLSEDDPQLVFERINSTGEDLTLADLVRNYLLMTDSNMEKLYENYWLPMENIVTRNKLVDFFETYLTFELPDNDKNQYQSFKKYMIKNAIQNEDMLIKMSKYSIYYSALIGNKNSYSSRVNNFLSSFRDLKQTTIYPFLFSVFNDFEDKVITEDQLVDVLQFFLNYTIRRAITKVPTNSLRGLYKTLYKRVFDKESKKECYLESIYEFMSSLSTSDAVPSDTSFKTGLKENDIYRNKDTCRLLLTILENGLSKLKENVLIDRSITIEHIMPQNRKNEDWHNEIGVDFYYVYDKYIHTLGNLTLSGYNSELSDKSFAEKKALLKSSKFTYLNQDVIDKDHWNEESILARAERLSTKIIDDLKLPPIFSRAVPKSGVKEPHTVNDGTDYTNKKITNYIFLGESYNTKSSRDFLIGICEILCNLDIKQFQNMAAQDFCFEGASTPFISYNQNNLRSPGEIGNSGMYIETNRSSNDIVKIIRKFLDLFSLAYEDLVFYTIDKVS